MKPAVYVNEITFNDGTQLSLKHNCIVVFTGANNCGKSQILKDIENAIDKSYNRDLIVANCIDCEYIGDIDEDEFFSTAFLKSDNGRYYTHDTSSDFTRDDLVYRWKEHQLVLDLHKLFVKRLDTENRLEQSNPLMRQLEPYKHPVYKFFKSEELAQKISDYFHKAYGTDLVINRNEMDCVPLHVGKAPDKTQYTIDKQDEYYSSVSKMPLLHNQGDGMRSFASLLLDTFTSNYSITLIDEPEAFLHPPQARLAGRILVENGSNERQIFIATHSEDFLQGLLDADNDNVTIIRINREENNNKISVLSNSEIKKLWSNPILRYSNILSGLFHDKVILCESDYDCLFYQAVIRAISENNESFAPDLLFIHCGGKHRMKDVISALTAVNVPVAAICDFDILNDKQTFKAITQSCGINWDQDLDSYMSTIYNSMNAKQGKGISAWENIKTIGKAGFTGDEPAAYEQVESICMKHGLFIVPVGEMECFDKTINKEKKEWVYKALQDYDLANEKKLAAARDFIQCVLNY